MEKYKFYFSVIIPVYKVEEYLEETLDSLVAQTIGFRENIQVILVNDGSPDDSDRICKQFKTDYPDNVVYIEKENGGVSSARNAGLPYAEGKYINFLDSDDKWDENAFLNAFEFFEEHYHEIDVLSCRVRKFDSTDDWHVLDFKFNKGNRVIDLSDEKRSILIQSHASTAFIKASAIEETDRFHENVKFGEDSMFINKLILRRLRYGIAENAVYYYRKRQDNSSATQVQNVTMEYYTTSPETYYESLVKLSVDSFGEVIPYIQNVLAYDIGWRVREAPADFILNDTELYEAYCNLLKKYLMYVDEKYIISHKVHRRIDYKIAMLRLKDGTELLSETHFDKENQAIFYKDKSLIRLQSNHKLCHITICKIRENKKTGKPFIVVEGLIARWVLESCKGERVDFVIRSGKTKFDVKRKPYALIKEKSFFGERNRYDYFRKKIPLDEIMGEKDRAKLEFCLSFSKKTYPITVNCGEFVPSADEFETAHRIYGDLILTCRSTHITVRKSADIEKDKNRLYEKSAKRLQKAQKENCLSLLQKTAEIRESLDGKKLWVMADSFNSAGDNCEAFFRFMNENPHEGVETVFLLSSESKDFQRVSSYGKVIDTESDEYKAWLLASDKIIASGKEDFIFDFLNDEEKIYLSHLMTSDVVFLDRELIAKDKSETHGKFSTNISLYCVARDKQLKTLLKGEGCYYKEEVKLTGAPRFDLWKGEKEKLIVILPFKIKDETAESFPKSKSFRFWNYVMNDRKLQFAMMKSGYKGLLCLPEEYREFADSFNENLFFKVCMDEAYDDVFRKGALLVTDYHPGFEFAYNERPVIYAHFEDIKKFYKMNPHRKGMFNFEKAGFGKICLTREETLEAIISAIKKKTALSEEYKDRGDRFFSFKDTENCRRVYEEIIKR